MSNISRVCVHAKPARRHRFFKEYETASVVVFVQADTEEFALHSAWDVLRRHCWEVLELQLCDLLVEDRVREQGGEVWNLYQQALEEGAALKVFPKHFSPGRDGIPAIQAPRVTEQFIDTVVSDVGGERLETDNEHRIADYRIDDWLFELKDLQEEGLLQKERQQRLAELFAPHSATDGVVKIDPEILSDDHRQRYFDIISRPIQGQVKSASKQIRSTKRLLNDESLRGGIIYVNTGYGSFPSDDFGRLVARYVKKDTSQIEAIFCVSTWSVTNGFDTNVFFRTSPRNPEHEVVRRLQRSFSQRFEEAMTLLMTGQTKPGDQSAAPLTPVAFAQDGLNFAWQPPLIPLPWNSDQSSSE